MKKLLLLIAICITTVANAQWQITKMPGDELKEIEEYYMNAYAGERGDAFAFASNFPSSVIILSRSGIFNYNYNDSNSVKITIGFYVDDKLVDKESTKFYVLNTGNSNLATLNDRRTPGLGLKIITHLKTKGDVRIIADRYSGSDYDVRIPMNKNLVVDGFMEVDDSDILIPELSR